jgi:virginiamycin A acetyltransferase
MEPFKPTHRGKMIGPDPNSMYPLKNYNKLIFLKNFIKSKNIHIGDYTYFDDSRNGPDMFETYNVLYNYEFSTVKLLIGKFCSIAAETRFILPRMLEKQLGIKG